jgi:UDP-N-acetyl-D-glucosamine dehydrogenase
MSIKDFTDVGVVGQGYVGLELAISLSKLDLTVLGFDLDSDRIKRILGGDSPVENVSNEDLKEAIKSNYFATVDEKLLAKCKVIVICVPTPISKSGKPDTSFLSKAVNDISQNISPGTLVINESTSFPGTLRDLIEMPIKSRNRDFSDTLFFAVAPERISPGDAVPMRLVSRVVSGTNEVAKTKVTEFYSKICANVLCVETPEIAELTKLLENSFRQINIAFINELSLLCKKAGIPILEVINAAATKPYGFMPFYPSSGIGGHCIPVDPMYLEYFAEQNGLELQSIKTAYALNSIHPEELCKLVLQQFPNRVGLKILVIGVSYKPGVSDIRETPATRIVDYLRSLGHLVSWYDSLVKEWNGEKCADLDGPWDVVIFNSPHPAIDRTTFTSKDSKIFDFGYSFDSIKNNRSS